MTKIEALHQFLSQFLPAYASSAVPQNAEYPYITFAADMGAFDSGENSITVDLWYRTEGEAVPNAKAQSISSAIGMGGVMLSCTGGALWLKRGKPFCQSMNDPEDDKIKRRLINITCEYITQD